MYLTFQYPYYAYNNHCLIDLLTHLLIRSLTLPRSLAR